MSRIASRDPEVVRLTAPVSRSDLLWVANTAHGPGGHWHARVRGGEPDHDHLAQAEDARTYLADHRVPVPAGLPDADALAELSVLRAMVQGLLDPDGGAWKRAGGALLAATPFQLDEAGNITSSATGWRGFCRNLLLPLRELSQDASELRQCANPACRLFFQDGSRNHARRWCDTAGCGNRDRVRRARGRRSDVLEHDREVVPERPAVTG
jgi:CGNR zinc finger